MADGVTDIDGVTDGVGGGIHSEHVGVGVGEADIDILGVTVLVGVGVIVIEGVTDGVLVGVTDGVTDGETEIVGVTLGVGFTTIFTGTLGADLAQLSLDLVLSNSVIPSFLFL